MLSVKIYCQINFDVFLLCFFFAVFFHEVGSVLFRDLEAALETAEVNGFLK